MSRFFRNSVGLLLVLSVLICFAEYSAAQEEQKEEPGKFKVFWREGLRFETADKKVKLRIAGRLQNDWMFASAETSLEDKLGHLEGGTEFRRARIELSGSLFGNVEFKFDYDLGGGDAEIKDSYVGLTKIPGLGTFRVGHFKEPFGMDQLTSGSQLTFLERSLADLFSPARNTGFAVMNSTASQRVTWAAGLFADTDNYGERKDNQKDFNLTLRLTALPWYRQDGRGLVHLGAAYSRRSPNDGVLRYRQRPESHLAYYFVDTKPMPADAVNQFGLEAAVVLETFSLQGEYVGVMVDSPSAGDPAFNSYYVYGTWFLTGESRSYNKPSGVFGRVTPRANWGGEGGFGAWELALRYSHLDLTDGLALGGVLDDYTVALNWYLNPHTKVQFEFVRAEREGFGAANVFQMRFHVDI
jgi:phosphate-selective porin OprO/OprP